jgi:hypothetical protein
VTEELWSTRQVADYWGVSLDRARHILNNHGIEKGYPASAVRAVPRDDKRAKQGTKAKEKRRG